MVSKVCVPGRVHEECVWERVKTGVWNVYEIPMKVGKREKITMETDFDGMPYTYILSFNRKNEDVTWALNYMASPETC